MIKLNKRVKDNYYLFISHTVQIQIAYHLHFHSHRKENIFLMAKNNALNIQFLDDYMRLF